MATHRRKITYTTNLLYKSHPLYSAIHHYLEIPHTIPLSLQLFSVIQLHQMALRGSEMGLVMVLATALWAGVSAQTGCNSAIISLSPCLSYIVGNSSTPSSACCTQLAGVVTNQAQCLCTVLNGGGSSFGLNLNQTQALALPGACNVQTPPLSQCKGMLHFALR